MQGLHCPICKKEEEDGLEHWNGDKQRDQPRDHHPQNAKHHQAYDPQQCMTLLMSLSGDDIVETTLLGPAGKEHGASLMFEEDAILLEEELESLEAP